MKRNKEARRIGREIEPYIYLVPTIVLFIFILAIPIFNLIRLQHHSGVQGVESI